MKGITRKDTKPRRTRVSPLVPNIHLNLPTAGNAKNVENHNNKDLLYFPTLLPNMSSDNKNWKLQLLSFFNQHKTCRLSLLISATDPNPFLHCSTPDS